MAKFRTSARTVDMLGRQQIAGIPTAISELFKNAHDAYATLVEADFYRPEKLLVLRDNGLGMTLEDVLERWLVLGTDSKLDGDAEMTNLAKALGMGPRQPTGEKGIGRLAIAAIGPQVLLVTRARRPDGLHPPVAAFVNWSLFELPGVSLDEIDVPVREFRSGELPSADDCLSLVDAVRQNLEQVRGRVAPDTITRIETQLDEASIDVAALQGRFESAALVDGSTGTHFYIQPTDPMLEVALEPEGGRRSIGDLQRILTGFTNTMMPKRPDPAIATAFRDHKSRDLFESVIGREEFFTPEEFLDADHHIQGHFDEYGQFSGTVAVYGGEPSDHVIAWPGARGRPTRCGPFSIKFAYVQGAARESRLPRERHAAIIQKLDRMGGLYVYRNGIRILPYGSADNDFLRIEERRNLGAAYYFFSARRMFGAIELPTDSSNRLIEKAGREGFRDNSAYRQFREILEHFLVQLAADYFRDETARGTEYRRTKTDLERQALALERQRQQSRARRRALEEALKGRAARLQSDEPQQSVGRALDRLVREVEAAAQIEDPDTRLRTIMQAERTARLQLSELGSALRAPQPRGFAVPMTLRRNLAAHRAEYAQFDSQVLKPAYDLIDEAISEATHGLDTARRLRFEAAAEDAWESARRAVMDRSRASSAQLEETRAQVANAVRQTVTDLETQLNEIAQRVQRTDLSAQPDEEVVQLRLDLEAEIDSIALAKEAQLDAISEQLRAIVLEPDESGQIVTQVDVSGAVDEELVALQERADADLELTQLGMAIEIIDHEFQATIRSIRSNLQRFRAWADVNEQLADVYHGIRVSFDHLDGYLTLFTPLHRRLYRSEIEIKGRDIRKFLVDLFRDRLDRHGVQVSASRAFMEHTFLGYPSTFYPVFVNLIDNAIFWLRDQEAPRTIRLDIEGDAMVVADNGPGIATEDRDAIFELGFTRKPGGRGLGLYISRDVLNRVGYELIVGDSPYGEGTAFTVRPRQGSDDD
ncbi:MAG: ATP-binding protein [Chloroflexi bacterium]|nr:ATP-binding protein [Chloroflexota bacterium]